jgi:outer membrane lipoprotein
MRPALVLAMLALLSGGCVSAFPAEAVRSANRSLTLAEIRRAPDAHAGETVILGGEILATRPRPGQTEIEVLGRSLEWDDSPERSDRSDGRFLARTAEFLDPAVFAAGRRVTVLGTITGAEERMVGELPYRLPVLSTERIHLWPRDPPPLYVDPYWPYGPWAPFPYWHGRHRYWRGPWWW